MEFCPRCRGKISFSDAELQELAEGYKLSSRAKEYEAAAEYARLLAEAEYGDFEREYAVMLEAGSIVPRDYDGAMKYFLRAAKKADAYSAYRYSRLVSRGNDRAGRFWLLYSAVLGTPEAYPRAAKLLAMEGNEEGANYFYALAAGHDDVDSIAELASRYFKGIGTSPSEESAKWYMEKLRFPPLYALKLAYKLRGVKSAAPQEINYDKPNLVRLLAHEAGKCEFKEPYFTLNKMLSELGDVDATTICATLLADGVGCRKDIEEAVRMFTEAASSGSAEAYVCLAEIFSSEEYEHRSPELTERYYRAAGMLGSKEAYMKLADLFVEGSFLSKDFDKAEKCYRRAADLGAEGAEILANEICENREKIYRDAISSVKENPKRAFRAFAIAAAMGHPKAPIRLADCYLEGVGTEKDRKSAYYWYKTAAEFGDDRALCPLGLCFVEGVGVNRDFKRAKEILEKAARIGIVGAKEAYFSLMETKRKKIQASLFSKAQRLLYKKKFIEAMKMAELSCELGHAKAAYMIGCMYEFGLGLACNRARAADFYDEAYRRGFSDAGVKYKKIILKLIR